MTHSLGYTYANRTRCAAALSMLWFF